MRREVVKFPAKRFWGMAIFWATSILMLYAFIFTRNLNCIFMAIIFNAIASIFYITLIPFMLRTQWKMFKAILKREPLPVLEFKQSLVLAFLVWSSYDTIDYVMFALAQLNY
jgi:hypothetical protein